MIQEDKFLSFPFFYSVGLHTRLELEAMVERMKSAQLRTINLSNNDLVKDHLRHLVIVFLNLSGFLCKRIVYLICMLEPMWNIII